MTRAVLVLTHELDATADLVVDELNRRGEPVVRADLDEISVAAELVRARWIGHLTSKKRTVALEEINSIYYRRPSHPRAPSELDPDIRGWVETEAKWGWHGLLAALPKQRWLNWPPAVHAAEHKPWQLVEAAAAGLRVPRTTVTNVPDSAARFAEVNSPVLYKSFRNQPVRIDGAAQLTYATPVEPSQCRMGLGPPSSRFSDRSNRGCTHRRDDNDMSSAPLRTALVDRLRQSQSSIDPAWLTAFGDIPRELFIPYYFAPNRQRPGWRLVARSFDSLPALYADDALVTQLNGTDDAVEAARRGEVVEGKPTSSSSAPGLMAAMLHTLDVADGMKVLEIGTGTGYNAGLLAHRLGQDNVTSVEVDAAVSARARHALTAAGHQPTLVIGNGELGHSPAAPYHRIIATVALPHVPPPLIQQCVPGGKLLLPLTFAGGGGLMVLLQREGVDRASGRFVPNYGGFMAVRDLGQIAAPTIRRQSLAGLRPAGIPPELLTTDTHPAAFYLSLLCPTRYTTVGFTPSDDSTGPQVWGRGLDGSTFTVVSTEDGDRVTAEGPLWNALESAHRDWLSLGCPTRERFGVTVAGARQWVWLDAPSNRVTDLSTSARCV